MCVCVCLRKRLNCWTFRSSSYHLSFTFGRARFQIAAEERISTRMLVFFPFKTPQTGTVRLVLRKQCNRNMRFGTWNVRSL